MEVYLVGGAVRDTLLGRRVHDRDFVVVGATVEEMLAKGYRQVGKDFPVFIHPHTGEQYALARTERKRGVGHRGFEVDASPDVTLEQDLLRRDLTVNAIAKDSQGHLIDPWGGVEDLKAHRLRPISEAFVEDPLRLMRVARFYATLPEFVVHPDTWSMMEAIVASGELASLSPERVWYETWKSCTQPKKFFEVIDRLGAWDPWWPELCGHNIPELPVRRVRSSDDPPDVGIAEGWTMLGYKLKLEKAEALCKRLRADKRAAWLLTHMAEEGDRQLTTATDWMLLFEFLDAWRQPERAQVMIRALRVHRPWEVVDRAPEWIDKLRVLKLHEFERQGYYGPDMTKALREKRRRKLSELIAYR